MLAGTQYIETIGLRKWENGSTIKFLFLNGTVEEREEVIGFANHLIEFANLNFEFYHEGLDENHDLRLEVAGRYVYERLFDVEIDLRAVGNYAMPGDSSHYRTRSKVSFNYLFPERIEQQRRGTVLHEFGHVLMLAHEHQREDRDPQLTDEYYESLCEFQNIPEAECERRYQTRTDIIGVTPYDSQSIMHYDDSIFEMEDENGDEIPLERITNRELFEHLSIEDRRTLAMMYPGRISEEQIEVTYERDLERMIGDIRNESNRGECHLLLPEHSAPNGEVCENEYGFYMEFIHETGGIARGLYCYADPYKAIWQIRNSENC